MSAGEVSLVRMEADTEQLPRPRYGDHLHLEADFNRWMLHERGYSRATCRTRMSTLGNAHRFMQARFGRPAIKTQAEHILAYLQTKPSSRTWNRSLLDLRCFFDFAIQRRYRSHDPTADIRRHPEPMRLPRPLPYAQAVALLKASYSISPRAADIVTLLLYTGLRREEACNLTWAEVDLESEPSTIRVLGKGSRERVLPLAPLAAAMLRGRWLGARGIYVFPSSLRRGRPMSAMTLWKDVRQAADLAGIACSPHRLRHTFATELLRRNGGKVRNVQMLLGHASLNSTQIYTQVVMDDLAPDVALLDFRPSGVEQRRG